MNNQSTISLVLAMLFVCSLNSIRAANIDPNNDGSQYAYGENTGWVNFEPNAPGPNVGATVSDDTVTGFIWAENIGWITLSPTTYSGIFNDGMGNLSGYAWAENVGWINFDPNVPSDTNNYGVKINSDGNFSGWGWGENIGWINFNSASLYGYGVEACKVKFADLGSFVEDWLQTGAGLPGDLDDSNDVDFLDYSILASYWLTFCPDDWPLK